MESQRTKAYLCHSAKQRITFLAGSQQGMRELASTIPLVASVIQESPLVHSLLLCLSRGPHFFFFLVGRPVSHG